MSKVKTYGNGHLVNLSIVINVIRNEEYSVEGNNTSRNVIVKVPNSSMSFSLFCRLSFNADVVQYIGTRNENISHTDTVIRNRQVL